MSRAWLITCLTLCAAPAAAEYMQEDLEQVPLPRLIARLEAKVEETPNDAHALHSLARLRAMAYARDLADDATLPVSKRAPASGVYEYQEPPLLLPDAQPEPSDAAQAHLEAAIALYARAEGAAPQDLRIKAGHAWCLAEAGQRNEARARFRKLLALAWEQEGDAESGGLGEFLYVELARYYVGLLDAQRDADELATVKARTAKLQALPRPVTPIAVPLADGLGPEDLLDRGAAVAFDLDGSGRALRWQWLAPSAAWLVYDHQGRGAITSALQLFGPRTFNLFHRDGYQALGVLDEDGDGVLRGGELRGLALWHDADGDGLSAVGEVRPLEAWGIVALGCRGEAHGSGIPWCPRGVQLADGAWRPSFDLVLERAE